MTIIKEITAVDLTTIIAQHPITAPEVMTPGIATAAGVAVEITGKEDCIQWDRTKMNRLTMHL
jgi:hypothetical protein